LAVWATGPECRVLQAFESGVTGWVHLVICGGPRAQDSNEPLPRTQVFDAETGKVIITFPPREGRDQSGSASAATWVSPTGQTCVAIGTAGGTLAIHDGDTGELLREVPDAHGEHIQFVGSYRLASGEMRVITGGDDNSVKVGVP
jgi:WD40 repeat protein